MFFPIGTDRELRRPPYVNLGLILANVLIFLFTERRLHELFRVQTELNQSTGRDPAWLELYVETLQNPLSRMFLYPDRAELYQFFTYTFLHSDVWHLLGNVVFLYVFGNAVEDKLGRLGYLAFYLAGGVVAGLGHALTTDLPVLGASGAVAGVTGMFLALYPLSKITIGYFLLVIIGSVQWASIWVIGVRVAQDVLFQLLGIGNVAYTAHLAGYAYGLACGAAVLLMRLVPRDRRDLLSVLSRDRREREADRAARRVRDAVAKSKAGEVAASVTQRVASKAEAEPELKPEPDAAALRDMADRRAIREALAEGRTQEAASRYGEMLKRSPGVVLPRASQLTVANTLMQSERHVEAAETYERFLASYPDYPQRDPVRLILSLIYTRYLGQPERAGHWLTPPPEGLSESEQATAEALRRELGLDG